MKSDYQKEEVAICLSVLLELMTILGTFRENIVLIGGWTPWFLIPGRDIAGWGQEQRFHKNSRSRSFSRNKGHGALGKL